MIRTAWRVTARPVFYSSGTSPVEKGSIFLLTSVSGTLPSLKRYKRYCTSQFRNVNVKHYETSNNSWQWRHPKGTSQGSFDTHDIISSTLVPAAKRPTYARRVGQQHFLLCTVGTTLDAHATCDLENCYQKVENGTNKRRDEGKLRL